MVFPPAKPDPFQHLYKLNIQTKPFRLILVIIFVAILNSPPVRHVVQVCMYRQNTNLIFSILPSLIAALDITPLFINFAQVQLHVDIDNHRLFSTHGLRGSGSNVHRSPTPVIGCNGIHGRTRTP
ncbi:hypothetical protein PM082_006996 [Marasmius tenuissimus]|nr:hypothetical protein PM082_006996 [Marasmius tenuissimus]